MRQLFIATYLHLSIILLRCVREYDKVYLNDEEIDFGHPSLELEQIFKLSRAAAVTMVGQTGVDVDVIKKK